MAISTSDAAAAAAAAVALRHSHPRAPARDILDVCLRQRIGRLIDFGPAIDPPGPFALLVAEAFDRGMTPEDWRLWSAPPAHPDMIKAVTSVWRHEVLLDFAKAYDLGL